jgi:hypothetical protein
MHDAQRTLMDSSEAQRSVLKFPPSEGMSGAVPPAGKQAWSMGVCRLAAQWEALSAAVMEISTTTAADDGRSQLPEILSPLSEATVWRVDAGATVGLWQVEPMQQTVFG